MLEKARYTNEFSILQTFKKNFYLIVRVNNKKNQNRYNLKNRFNVTCNFSSLFSGVRKLKKNSHSFLKVMILPGRFV